MSVGTIILGVLLFALVTAILYAWVLKKSVAKEEDMTRALLNACGSRVVKHLKKHGTASAKEIAGLLEGGSVHPVWSKNKMKVQDGKKVAPQVIEFLLEQQYIRETGKGTYELKP